VTGWIVFFVCVAGAAVSVAAWFDGYAEGVADGTRLLVEWCKAHVGDSKAICGNELHTTDKYSRSIETRR
jgi:hypothetical protein